MHSLAHVRALGVIRRPPISLINIRTQPNHHQYTHNTRHRHHNHNIVRALSVNWVWFGLVWFPPPLAWGAPAPPIGAHFAVWPMGGGPPGPSSPVVGLVWFGAGSLHLVELPCGRVRSRVHRLGHPNQGAPGLPCTCRSRSVGGARGGEGRGLACPALPFPFGGRCVGR